jgi:protein involved in polysaccharide export with SLBB domain
LLLDGDWIFVPRRDFNSFISIYGAVNKQGVYEFVEGDSLKDLIAIAGGFLESADIENIEISRLDENGALKEKIQVNFKDILDGKAPDIKLEKNDRILVPEKRTLKQDYKVYVDGEVNYPGFYPISRNGTKLSEILEKAGINRYAELGEAIILRGRANNYKDIHELYPALLLKGFGLADEDSIYFNRELRLLSSFQFVAVNLEDVINGKSDCELQDNDLIYIPPKTNSVYVFGQVNNPGFVEYKDGEDYRYYISKAGGFSQLARKGDVKVIKRKTYNWYDAESVTIEPGDFILVPKKIPRSASYYFRVIRDASLAIGGIISSLILILNILNQFKK